MDVRLPEGLRRIGAELVFHPPEDGTPVPWAVYDCAEPAGSGDIIGCGFTPEQAIADACDQLTRWDVNGAILAGVGR